MQWSRLVSSPPGATQPCCHVMDRILYAVARFVFWFFSRLLLLLSSFSEPTVYHGAGPVINTEPPSLLSLNNWHLGGMWVQGETVKTRLWNVKSKVTGPVFIHIQIPLSRRPCCVVTFYETMLQIFLFSSHLAFNRADYWGKEKVMRFQWDSKCEIRPNRKDLHSEGAQRDKER